MKIQQYRSMCLLNVTFKVLTKVGTNGLTIISKSVFQPMQTSFIPGRHILKGGVTLHETINEIYRKEMDGVLF
jgi:hypothetical protein